MDEKPKSIWKKSLKGPNWLWLLLIPVMLVFAAIYVCGNVPASLKNYLGLPAYAFLLALFVALVLVLAVKFFRWVFCWRNLKRFLFGLACFATLIALFYAEENWRGKHDWENSNANGRSKVKNLTSPISFPRPCRTTKISP